MCRISGIIDRTSKQLYLDTVAMRDSMAHGGPDNAGVFVDEGAGLALGHRRLSIIDLCETGNQPMWNEEKWLGLVYNGEIYNYRELKEELIKAGKTFFSTSDTEVILRAYEVWGVDCFKRFRGMFALGILDRKENRFLLARDHAGIKPLYYAADGDSLYFASEMRAFKQLKPQWEEDETWKIYFLTYGYLPPNVTTLKNVKSLEKGAVYIFDLDTLEHKKVFFFQDNYNETVTTLEEAKALVRSSLDKAVKRHLVSDVPVAVLLSGGIDSSLLTILAKEYIKNLHTFSVDFDEDQYSEMKYQKIIANKTGSIHQSFLINERIFFEALPDILTAMDQPSSDGINSYFISKFAKQAGVKVLLSGLGADELFGGYPSFHRSGFINKLKLLPDFIINATQFSSVDKLRKVAYLKQKNAIGEHLFNRGYFTPLETAKILGTSVEEVSSVIYSTKLPPFINSISSGNQVSYLESNLYMKGQLLKDTDSMSMWHSTEVRVPFLDQDVITTVQSISSDIKFGNAQSKFLLIESFKDILPTEIWKRKKQGFVFPFDKWMKEHAHVVLPDNYNKDILNEFRRGNLSWSRYWTYLLSQTFSV